MKKFLFDCGTRDATASLAIFALRVMIGLMMLIGHGIPKIQHFMALKDFPTPSFMAAWMSPMASLCLTILAEAVASTLIILGLATRPATFVLAFTMVIAAFDIHRNAPWFISPPTVLIAKELALLYLIPLIAIILSGAGSISLDALFLKKPRRRW
jgi:putative oxidoreductase